jgi:hypothetical protein
MFTMTLGSLPPARPAAARRDPLASYSLASARPWRTATALCIALTLFGVGCGSDPAEPSGGSDAGGGLPGGGSGSPGGGSGTESDASAVVADGSVPASDASIQPSIDGGTPIPLEPPKPVLDAAISGKPVGNAYAETEYNLERPEALKGAFGTILSLTGNTRMFINELRAGDAGVEVLYGAADSSDAGLVWQPRSFRVGLSPTDSKTFVSEPFTYVIEARIVVDATSGLRLYLESEQTTWTATFSDDHENITTGALYGIVTRAHAESRPLDIGSCTVACGLNSFTYCLATNDIRLATVFDCNEAQMDADVNGDGTNDGYRMILSFKSRRVEPPRK